MVAFYERNTQIFKRLLDGEGGVWLIDYENPSAPVFASFEEMEHMALVPVPEGYLWEEPCSEKRKITQQKRLDIIRPLVEEEACIWDKKKRGELLTQVADSNRMTCRTVRKLYFRYLAGGEQALLPAPRTKNPEKLAEAQKGFRWAINKYYYSSRKMSLKDTYHMLLLAKYTDENGQVTKDAPTFGQFRYFHYAKADPVKKAISQKGIANYQRNLRPLYGKASSGKTTIGAYEMDATQADLYLVSRYDRSQPIGRPIIYLAVDVVSRLIAGVYVGFEMGTEAVMQCLRCAAMDKRAFCAEYGVSIRPEEWPCSGLPSSIITDRGREFLGGRMDDLCAQYGITCTGLPPYRPDLKGLVEKAFDILQGRYKSLLRYKGVIEKDFQERGAPDYRREAALNLYEFTQVLLYCVLFYNSVRLQKGFLRTPEMARDNLAPVASHIWNWHRENGLDETIPLSEEDAYFTFLPREQGKLSRKGLEFRNLTYFHEKFKSRCAAAGIKGKETVTVAYDPLKTDKVYLLENGEYIPFCLTNASHLFEGLSYAEVQAFLKREKKQKKALEQQEIQGELDCISRIQDIVRSLPQTELHTKEALEKMEEAQKREKGDKII